PTAGRPHTESAHWIAQTSVCASEPAVHSGTASSPAVFPVTASAAPAVASSVPAAVSLAPVTGYTPPLPAEDFAYPDSWRFSLRVDFLFPLYRKKCLNTRKRRIPG